jgi:hypothetical protein
MLKEEAANEMPVLTIPPRKQSASPSSPEELLPVLYQ